MKKYMILIFWTMCSLEFSAQIIDTDTGGDEPFDPSTSSYDPQSFRPIPGEQYVFSAWVRELNPEQQITYSNCSCELVYSLNVSEEFVPQGNIIDGWQLISGTFTLPENAMSLNLKFNAVDVGIDCLFDDVRVFPFNGNMKSFVYDPITQRLMAELDENNYATFYEYDIEGGLVRVKKETERGVKTIQETRSGNAKSQ